MAQVFYPEEAQRRKNILVLRVSDDGLLTDMHGAQESFERVKEYIAGTDMVFVVAELGEDIGADAAASVAKAAKDTGKLVIGIVIAVFGHKSRPKIVRKRIARMESSVDTLLIAGNEKLSVSLYKKAKSSKERPTFSQWLRRQYRKVSRMLNALDGLLEVGKPRFPFVTRDEAASQREARKCEDNERAYRKADADVRLIIREITGFLEPSGTIDVDFADLEAIMKGAGLTIMSAGAGEGDTKAELAARAAVKFPSTHIPIRGAKKILISLTVGEDVGLLEMTIAVEVIKDSVGKDATVVWSYRVDDSIGDAVRVTVFAGGFL
jgi:cell division protein FtsZ